MNPPCVAIRSTPVAICERCVAVVLLVFTALMSDTVINLPRLWKISARRLQYASISSTEPSSGIVMRTMGHSDSSMVGIMAEAAMLLNHPRVCKLGSLVDAGSRGVRLCAIGEQSEETA